MAFPKDTRLRLDVMTDRCAINSLTKLVSPDTDYYLLWAVFTRIVILVRDLVAKSETYAKKPIVFTDDVIIKGRVKDVATLITFMRDAVCHIESDRHMAAENMYSSGHVMFGKKELYKIEGIELGCEYADDIAFSIGPQRMYFERHLLRAFREATDNLDQFFNEPPNNET
jgi:hypothetical protein